MSRSLDLLLLGLVGGLGWWLFAREERPLDEVVAAPPAPSSAEFATPPSATPAQPEAPAPPSARVSAPVDAAPWALDTTSGLPEGLPVRLGERFVRIGLDVRDKDGRVVHDARLSLGTAEPARTLDGAQSSLPVDADGKVLVPRRSGVRIDVRSAHGTATVDDPFDGRTVQLTPR